MKKDGRNSTVQVLGFILFLFAILFLYKYLTTNYYPQEIARPQVRVRCPQGDGLQKTYEIPEPPIEKKKPDTTISMHENDLNLVHNKFNLYNIYNQNSGSGVQDHPGFENELGNNIVIDKTLTNELDEVYFETSAQDMHDNAGCEYSKPHSTDLPLANVPVFLLTNDKSVRLSDNPV